MASLASRVDYAVQALGDVLFLFAGGWRCARGIVLRVEI